MIHQFRCLSCGGVYPDTLAAGTTYHHACPPLPRDRKKPLLIVEREDKRDERIAHDRYGRLAGIVSEGKGVECLTNKALTEQPWLTKLKARAEKEQETINA